MPHGPLSRTSRGGRPPSRRRSGGVVLGAAALLLVGTAQGAVAAPREAAHRPQTAFASSFEDGQSAPDWLNTADTDASGKPRRSGVDGAYSSGIPGNVTDHVTAVRASAENTAGGEVAANLADGLPGTKWLTFENKGWVEFDLDAPQSITRYALVSANDHDERDPRDWTLQGSADGKEWKTLDTRAGERFTERAQSKTYEIGGTPAAYAHYRLDVTANNGGPDATQLAEVQLSAGGSDPAPPKDMSTLVDHGPSGSPTAKAGAGFTGTHALRYSGTHQAKGRGYAYNKVFDVNVKVRKDTTLSYKIFPSLPATDLDYPATYVAVDLAFTDGTYLSDLNAVDQLGFRLSPRGQGASKALYVNQWNDRSARIGSVAAGKTIDRVLLGYDADKGPHAFRGWVDDISVKEEAAPRPKPYLSDYATTTRGTNSSGDFSRGNNIPATAVPHGFNFWTPVTNAGSTSWLYDYARSNNSDNLPTMQAIAASHEPSPWMGDRQTFQVMPSLAAGTPPTGRTERALPFRHENESAKPYEYAVTYENGLRAQVTPTDHAAALRFTYPGDDASVIFDNVSEQGGLTLDKEHGTVTGYSDVKSGLSTGATRLFVYGVFDKKVTGGDSSGVKGYLRFDAGRDRTVTLRLATSLIGVDQAKANLEQEIPARKSYAAVRTDARAQWEKLMRTVTVEGASEDQLTTLYSSLYRLYLYPNSGFENTGSGKKPTYQYASPFSKMPGPDTATHTGAKIVDGKVYVNNGFWDTYRTTWPAYSLLTPKKAGELVDGFVQQYKDGGWISRWSSPGYADLMTGTSSDVAFADAYTKGVDFDAKAGYEAALKNATVVPPSSGVGRKGMKTSPFLGYTSTDTGEGMSWAMEGYVNDYGIGRMGEALYKKTGEKRYKEESEYFLNRAQDYVKMFDKDTGFFQGRKADGSWRLPADKYDPRVWGYDYTETNGWGYAFTAPQDAHGLANLYGGRDGLAKKLDTYFSTPETATAEFTGSYGGVIHEMTEARDVRMGQYGHSNQVAHHAAYMYDAAGQPWKTQEKIREVLSRLYSGSSIGQGYHGDEDNGEQSAWYLFSALGFYPLVMGGQEYAIGSPLFTKATLRLENGKKFTVTARGNSAKNIYVQSARLNGKKWDSTALPSDAVAKGGTLEFVMGPKPSSWGSGKTAGPRSLTQGDAVAKPRSDALLDGQGPLTDNTSATEGPLTRDELPVGEAVKAVQYTLTSADRAKAPSGWVLQGSADGTSWRDLDKRVGESFAYDQQTRVFSVARPGTYAHYRIVPDAGGTDAAAPRVAEVELLG